MTTSQSFLLLRSNGDFVFNEARCISISEKISYPEHLWLKAPLLGHCAGVSLPLRVLNEVKPLSVSGSTEMPRMRWERDARGAQLLPQGQSEGSTQEAGPPRLGAVDGVVSIVLAVEEGTVNPSDGSLVLSWNLHPRMIKRQGPILSSSYRPSSCAHRRTGQ